MKVKLNKPCRVNLLSGEAEVTEVEYNRLKLLGVIDETPVAEPKKKKKQEAIPEE